VSLNFNWSSFPFPLTNHSLPPTLNVLYLLLLTIPVLALLLPVFQMVLLWNRPSRFILKGVDRGVLLREIMRLLLNRFGKIYLRENGYRWFSFGGMYISNYFMLIGFSYPLIHIKIWRFVSDCFLLLQIPQSILFNQIQ
jgi:hypothetical protein